MTLPLQWLKTGENEFTIGKNVITLLDKSIVSILVVGEQTDEHVRLIKEVLPFILSHINGNMKQLVDLNHAGKMSPTARQFFKELNESNITDRVAIYGIHPVAKVLASFVTGFIMQSNIRYFNNREDALDWLRN